METVEKILKDIDNQFDRFADHIGAVITFYMYKGWFFDYEIPIDAHRLEIFLNEPIIFEGFMKMYFRDRIENIEKIVAERFPKRYKIISKAFLSHKNGDYELSIPVIIGQVDGIFRDFTNKDMFSSRDNRAEKVFDKFKNGNLNNQILTAALTPLKEYRLLTLSFSKSKDYPNIVSRNAILHGYEIDYANEENSLKTISLLNYVVRVVYDILTGNNYWLQQQNAQQGGSQLR